jgi:hypothetical protein
MPGGLGFEDAAINDLRAQPGAFAAGLRREAFPEQARDQFRGHARLSSAGSRQSGKSSGNGAIRFTSLEPGKAIGYHLDFEIGHYLSEGTITLVANGGATKATSTNGGELGNNPFGRWFGLFMDSLMGPDLETACKISRPASRPPSDPQGNGVERAAVTR